MKHELWLYGEDHARDEDEAEDALPPPDVDLEDELGEEDRPERLREDQRQRVAQRHEGQAGKLEEHATTWQPTETTIFTIFLGIKKYFSYFSNSSF